MQPKQVPQSLKNKRAKKGQISTTRLDVEMGSFTPLVFVTNGGMGTEYQRFVKPVAEKISTLSSHG